MLPVFPSFSRVPAVRSSRDEAPDAAFVSFGQPRTSSPTAMLADIVLSAPSSCGRSPTESRSSNGRPIPRTRRRRRRACRHDASSSAARHLLSRCSGCSPLFGSPALLTERTRWRCSFCLFRGAAASPSGVVYAAAVNHREMLDALGAAASQPPYKSPPRSVVLYVKPRNTFVPAGGDVEAATGGPTPDARPLVAGASLGIVIGRPASAVSAADAPTHIAVSRGRLRRRPRAGPPQVPAKRAPSLTSAPRSAPHAVGNADALASGLRRRLTRADTPAGTVRGVAPSSPTSATSRRFGVTCPPRIRPGLRSPTVQRVAIDIDRVGRSDAHRTAARERLAGSRRPGVLHEARPRRLGRRRPRRDAVDGDPSRIVLATVASSGGRASGWRRSKSARSSRWASLRRPAVAAFQRQEEPLGS